MPISEDYLSTSLRWALFKADHPDGFIEFSEATPEELGIPSSFHKGGDKLCVATLCRFRGDEYPVIAFKSESDAKMKDTDAWHVLCSKAMGRALKKAGYPDKMSDLKVLMNFRKANSPEQPQQQVAVTYAQPSVTTTAVHYGAVEKPDIRIENKENPAPRQSLDWSSDEERDMAHNAFKLRAADMNDDERKTLRDHHEKLNGKSWPMPKPDLNNLSICLEGIYASRHDAEIEEESLVETAPLKAIFEMLNEDVQAEIVSAYGQPSTWPDKVSEHEYEEMMNILEFAEEGDD